MSNETDTRPRMTEAEWSAHPDRLSLGDVVITDPSGEPRAYVVHQKELPCDDCPELEQLRAEVLQLRGSKCTVEESNRVAATYIRERDDAIERAERAEAERDRMEDALDEKTERRDPLEAANNLFKALKLDFEDSDCGWVEDTTDDPAVLRECLKRQRLTAAVERLSHEARALVADIEIDPAKPFAARIVVGTPTGDRAHERDVAAGWRCVGEAGGGSWNRADRPRVDEHPTQTKLRWEAT